MFLQKLTSCILFCCLSAALAAQTNSGSGGKQAASGRRAKAASVAIPSLATVYGVASLCLGGVRQVDYNIRNQIVGNNAIWHTRADDYFQFAPAAAAFAMKLAGVESRNRSGDMIIAYGLSNLLMSGSVLAVKHITGRMRPDGSNSNSFPSGHTATAFVAAEFLHQEFGGHSAWISVCGYAGASLVGVARIFNNKHWLSDVVAGAGIGVLSTKAAYLLYPQLQRLTCKKDKNRQAFVCPVYVNRQMCMNFSYVF